MNDDGSLHTPEGDFARDEIVGLDMDRWMSKSIAYAETKDAKIKLDDYIYKNMHLIVGALAQRFAPDKWTEEAKKIDPDAEAELLQKITDRYNEQTSPYYAAARLWVDGIIDPVSTRDIISRGIEAASNVPELPRYNVGVIQT